MTNKQQTTTRFRDPQSTLSNQRERERVGAVAAKVYTEKRMTRQELAKCVFLFKIIEEIPLKRRKTTYRHYTNECH